MAVLWLAKGAALGFAIAAPVGPIGVLCLRRSLTDGASRGLAVGLGAATADAFYGAVAAFGLTAISAFFRSHLIALQAAGGLFLLFLGIRSWSRTGATVAHTITGSRATRGPGPVATWIGALGLTLTNPLTILSFVAVFAGFGLPAARDSGAAALMVAGIFLGSTLWWILLSCAAAALAARLGAGLTRTIARASAVVLLAFGVVSTSSAIRALLSSHSRIH